MTLAPAINEELAAFLQSGLSIAVCTRDERLAPEGARVWSVRVEPDRAHLEAFVYAPSAGPTLANLERCPVLAIVFDRPHDNTACQVKGEFVGWRPARDEKWHFPVCIEVLPGRFDLEVHYFAREHDDELEQSVSRQAESTVPSLVTWQAEAGRVYRLRARLGAVQPSATSPPQRHIPRSRALGTTWWGLEESEWTAEIEPAGSFADPPETLVEERQAWVEWEERRR